MKVTEWHQLEDWELAKSNGITYMVFYTRIYYLGWPVKKAATEPIKKHENSLWRTWKDTCEKHGVNQGMFFNRVYAGWGFENAATLPKGTLFKNINRKGPKITPELLERATQNGINKYTLHARIHLRKWDVERAVTEPTHSQYRRKDL